MGYKEEERRIWAVRAVAAVLNGLPHIYDEAYDGNEASLIESTPPSYLLQALKAAQLIEQWKIGNEEVLIKLTKVGRVYFTWLIIEGYFVLPILRDQGAQLF